MFLFYLFSSDVFIILRYVVFMCIACPADAISSQGICDHFQKQDTGGVFWDPGIGEISCVARIIFCLVSDCHGPPSNSGRRFQPVWIYHRTQVPVGSAITWHGFWYVVGLVPVGGVIPRITDHREHLELSAFLVIVLGAYRNKGTLKFSALVRTIVTEATIYFFVMVAAQTYIQLSAVLMRVLSLFIFLLHSAIAESNTSGYRGAAFVTVSMLSTSMIIVHS